MVPSQKGLPCPPQLQPCPTPILASLMSAYCLQSIIVIHHYVIYLFVYLVVVYLHPLECKLPKGKDFILCTSTP